MSVAASQPEALRGLGFPDVYFSWIDWPPIELPPYATHQPVVFSFEVLSTGGVGGGWHSSAIATPVAEPSTWLMVLAGLAVVAYMAFRKGGPR